MGKNAAQILRKSGVSVSIISCQLSIISFSRHFCRFILVCVLCAFAADFSHAQKIAQADLELLALKIKSGSIEQKRDALFAIRNFQNAETSRLAVPALQDSSEIVRATATASVIFLPADEAAQNLLPLLNDKSSLVRREAAYALGKTHNSIALKQLVERFQSEKTAEVKNACVIALGEIGDVGAVDFLTRILQKKPKKEDDGDKFLRRSAAHSIGQIAQIIQTGKPEVITPERFSAANYPKKILPNYKNLTLDFPIFSNAVKTLIQTLQNKNEADDTRRETAFALGAIGDESAKFVLQSNSNSADNYLADICRESLEKLEKVSKEN